MKSIFIRLIILVFGLFFASAPSFCQVPGSINYQAVARDGSGNTLINQLVSFRLSILQGSPSGAVVYAESHVYTSNQFGLVTLKIGGGTVLSGNFSAIDWGRDDYYLQTEMDPSGGTAYLLTGTSQFLSVPYALYSKTSGNALPAGTAGQTLRNDGTTWIPNSTIYNGGSKVGVGIATPDNSAMLEVNSANKGFLPPRMTHAEMSAITDPAEGLMVFCTDCGVNGTGVVVIFMNGAWNTIAYTCILPASPISGTQVPSPAQIVWNWNTVSGAAGYKWNTTNNYGTAIDMFTTTSKTETGLTCNTPYTRYAWAYSACGSSTPVTLMQTTTGTPPSAPTAGGHMPSANQIVWNWNTVSGATGYKWNTSNNYATATDMGSATSKTETGLTCNTGYTRYAWSYSACGNSAPVTLTQTTTLNPPIAPAAGTHVPSATQIVWNWNNVPGASGYKWNTTNSYGTATDMAAATSKTETGLACNTAYTRYAWAYSVCGNSTPVTLSQTTSPNPPAAPTAGIHVPSATQIVWNWNSVSGATGYKWNTTNDFATATDLGTATTKTETGLACNTAYTRYAWAYSVCGNSTPVTLSQTTSLNPPAAPTAGTHEPSVTQILWKWNSVPDATGYKWNSLDDFESAEDVGSNTSYEETDLTCNSSYTRYAWAYSACGNSASVALEQSTILNSMSSPTSGTHVPSETQIVWNWNTVFGATGYKWNTTNDYASATDMGTARSKTETGLIQNTAYSRFVWAYQPCGLSISTTLTQSTSGDFCGSSFSINHLVTGGVAPVNKLTTYGTVTNIPGEPSKCWITSNLGADHQATAVNDATEASAGWYWQFNRKQGYKNDGATATPLWTLTSINENLDWQTANDPCGLELGGTWRVPTSTEWGNISASGGWTNSTGPWTCGLKLHVAGMLNYSDGTIGNRGFAGYYNSSTQYNATNSWNLVFSSEGNHMPHDAKAYGFSVRCIKDTCSFIPNAPDSGTHVPSGTQIIWNWAPVTGATGYKWNTTNDYATATDMGTDTSKTETGLIKHAAYTRFVWAYNTCGHSPATTLDQFLPFEIGDSYGGGIVFYIDSTLQHGLIAALQDEWSAMWGCPGIFIPGTSTDIGTGLANTAAIVTGCTQHAIAAILCYYDVMNGYDDWYLPSIYELHQMYLQRGYIGGFSLSGYWSSSQYNESGAWFQDFNGGGIGSSGKGNYAEVRAIRSY